MKTKSYLLENDINWRVQNVGIALLEYVLENIDNPIITYEDLARKTDFADEPDIVSSCLATLSKFCKKNYLPNIALAAVNSKDILPVPISFLLAYTDIHDYKWGNFLYKWTDTRKETYKEIKNTREKLIDLLAWLKGESQRKCIYVLEDGLDRNTKKVCIALLEHILANMDDPVITYDDLSKKIDLNDDASKIGPALEKLTNTELDANEIIRCFLPLILFCKKNDLPNISLAAVHGKDMNPSPFALLLSYPEVNEYKLTNLLDKWPDVCKEEYIKIKNSREKLAKFLVWLKELSLKKSHYLNESYISGDTKKVGIALLEHILANMDDPVITYDELRKKINSNDDVERAFPAFAKSVKTSSLTISKSLFPFALFCIANNLPYIDSVVVFNKDMLPDYLKEQGPDLWKEKSVEIKNSREKLVELLAWMKEKK